MKKVLMASTAVAAFVAFSGTAQAQDPGMADFGATEGGGGAGSAFTVKTNGAVKFYLKYASGDESLNDGKGSNSGLFALMAAELEFNGAATTDNGTDISTHIDLDFSGIPTDTAQATSLGGGENTISVGNIVRVQELSMKIGGGWGSVELGTNDGAEDSLKTYGGSIAAGTGGVDGDQHNVDDGPGYVSIGGLAGSGDSGDALKATYLSPKVAGFQTGLSLVYATDGPNDINGGTLGVGLGAKYAGSSGGFDYTLSLVWGDRAVLGDTSGSGIAERMLSDSAEAASNTAEDNTRISYYETAHDRAYDLATTVTAGTNAAAIVVDAAIDAADAADRATPDAQYAAIRTAAITDTTSTERTMGYDASITALNLAEGTAATAEQMTAATTAGNDAVTAAAAAIAEAGVAAGATAAGAAAGVAAGDAGAAANEAARAVIAGAAGTLALDNAANKAGIAAAGEAASDATIAEGVTPIEAAKRQYSDGARGAFDGHYGGLGLGVKLGGAGVTGVFGVTLDGLGRNKDYYSTVVPVLDAAGVALTGGGSDTFTIRDDSGGVDINISTGVAYAIPGGKSNVSLTAALALPYGVSDAEGETEASNHLNAYLVSVSADYAILPGVTIATDLGYGDRDVDNEDTKSGGFTGLIRVKAAF